MKFEPCSQKSYQVLDLDPDLDQFGSGTWSFHEFMIRIKPCIDLYDLQLLSLADLGGGVRDARPPGRPNSFDFMQFSGKFGVFTPPLEGSRPPLGKILDPPLTMVVKYWLILTWSLFCIKLDWDIIIVYLTYHGPVLFMYISNNWGRGQSLKNFTVRAQS